MITAERSYEIGNEVILGKTEDPADTPEEKAFRKKVESDINSMKAKGYTPEIPYEWPKA